MEEAELELAKTNLPPEPVLNNLLRYETTIERRLDKAIARWTTYSSGARQPRLRRENRPTR